MNCQMCGAEFKQHARGRRKLYCSRTCSARSAYKPKLKVTKNCDACGKEFVTAKSDQHFCSKECRIKTNGQISNDKFKAKMREIYPDGIKRKDCAWCGEVLEVPTEKGQATRSYHFPKCQLEAQRARYRIKTVKRQNKMTMPRRIAADQVVLKYGNDCHICNHPIDLSLARTSRMGLTVDHVIPLSKGGSDELDNLRPAHWICNNRKSDKIYG